MAEARQVVDEDAGVVFLAEAHHGIDGLGFIGGDDADGWKCHGSSTSNATPMSDGLSNVVHYPF